MAETASVIEENVEKIQKTFKNLEGDLKKDWKKLHHNVLQQGKKLGKNVEKKTTAEWKKIKATPIGKRADHLGKQVAKLSKETTAKAEELRRETNKKLETSVETVLGAFQIASKSEIDKLDKKLSAITRKLKEIEDAKVSKPAAAAAKKEN